MLSQTFANSSFLGILLDLPILLVAWLHIFLAPYNKVEESFNLHATHDILAYGVTRDTLPNYDHFTFPGVVPRTFIGSLVLAAGSYLPLRICTALGFIQSKLGVQLLIRLCLATINVYGLVLIRWSVQRRFGRGTSALFILLTCTQFHLPFWVGRTLPNMFALFPVNMATSLYIYPGSTSITVWRHYRIVLCLIGAPAIMLRSELVLLLLPLLPLVLFRYQVPLGFLIPMGLTCALGSLASTIFIDSYFWNTWNPPLWPELSGILFNVYEGKSSEWGTSPWHAYLTHHLPKLLLGSTPLALFACLPSKIEYKENKPSNPAWELLTPYIIFTLLISGLGHKEWRFVVYVVPMINVVAAVGANRLLHLPTGPLRMLGRLTVLGLVGCNIAATVLLTAISRANYPGGEALALVNSLSGANQQTSVWIDNLAAQTGASLFTQAHSPPYFNLPSSSASADAWTYSKDPNPASYDAFTYLVVEDPGAHPIEKWDVVGSVDAFERVDIKRLKVVTKPTLFVLRNKNHV
ncbi:ALG12-alpha-1,6-mannosyltransferase-like protein [Rhizoctonia solani 123E]|uniref:Mannosyltransferase n=1 Tax=Rhizoctonia solani 123E TaxID=1423351 RepID=A0A074S5W8_9AGAM|nr:ALG12-alpha-1,6-mannosyltransferase-like protein [Rhizoctonia solani 123E]